ncbi:hypothetical protein L249_3829 [Ophiocordyceps polyrhachis-furcata BCC 54312]|uniref:Uncharacterized protein n=1 Tax=Ophiocordyceps polyrhachis-furcata BCC 54312 TaxID=1330021 RepID=A0A367L5F7_9HYPO|nr:hypothetical protein L249_3829 [Ophiocordyceps polyrhachis-furcata BCC 54312]
MKGIQSPAFVMGPLYVLEPKACVLENQTCVWRSRISDGECQPWHPIRIASNPYTQRVATTEFFSLETLCSQDTDGVNPGQDCCRAYGIPCGLRRYQELWCQPSDPVEEEEEEEEEEKKKEEEEKEKRKKEKKKKLDERTVTAQTCTNKGRTCQWYGSAPSCGGNEKEVGLWNTYNGRSRQLVVSTELGSKQHVCGSNSSWFDPKSGDCCDKYGWSCLSGYKRLWCYE